MGRVGSRRKIGGKALASGADGCVFDVRFLPDGSTQIVDGIVSKVFPKEKKAVAENEYSILALVNKTIPDGKGVVVGNVELKTISDVKDEIGNKGRTNDFTPNACGRIVNQKQRSESPFYVLEYPRVDGSMLDLKTMDVPLSFFEDAIHAVQTLSKAGLVHTDIATRNIFVKGNTGLIGDFGNMININDERNLSAVIKSYIDKNTILSIGDCLSANEVSSTARIAMLMYVSEDLQPLKEEMENLVTEYKNKSRSYWFSDTYFEAKYPLLREPLTQNMKQYLDTMATISNKNVIKAVMLHELKQSDIRMLAIVMLDRAVPSTELNNKVMELWGNPHSWAPIVSFNTRLAALKGSRRTRRKRVKMSRKT